MHNDDEILQEYAREGYRLDARDDHVITLWFKDAIVAAFSQSVVTAAEIRDVCRRHKAGLMEAKI